jgi:DNA polymerase IV
MALDFPKFYLMGIGFENQSTALLDLQRQIGSIVTNNEESSIFVGKVSKAKRAAMELKSLKIFTEPVEREGKEVEEVGPPAKKPRIAPKSMDDKEFVWIDSDTASEDGSDGDVVIVKGSKSQPAGPKTQGSGARSALTHKKKTDGDNIVTVVQLAWLTDSLNAGKVLPLDEYVVYTGTRISKPSSTPKPQPTKLPQAGILSRARDDSPPPATFSQTHKHKRGISYAHGQSQYSQNKRPPLLHESTTEHEEAINLPPLPEYCKKEYCCQRPTPSPTPNDPFIAQLRKILRTRQLISDDIGERAYNKAIAAIAAYPFTITTVEEILRLPGCGPKYAILYQEWRETGHLREVDEEFEHNEKMQVLNLFYGILDVGPKTANLLYEKGYRDLDDIVERGWDTLDKNQQVGVKYYDDFQAKIPREEVERIGDVVLGYANDLHQGFQMVICGGYRRGKKMCGDVDIILTHPEENVTDLFIDDIVYALAEDGWIKYKLQFSHRNSERGQEPVEWKGGMPRSGGGFDTLDKALVVWQDPNWPTREADLEKDPKAKNPNTHRRVDIIVSPWKTAGCAILGWSGANMFERDIRRYCRKELHYKFDSSGVRSLDDGSWVNLEGDETDLLTKEKKVFEGLGLDWIEPTLRCTDG